MPICKMSALPTCMDTTCIRDHLTCATSRQSGRHCNPKAIDFARIVDLWCSNMTYAWLPSSNSVTSPLSGRFARILHKGESITAESDGGDARNSFAMAVEVDSAITLTENERRPISFSGIKRRTNLSVLAHSTTSHHHSFSLQHFFPPLSYIPPYLRLFNQE